MGQRFGTRCSFTRGRRSKKLGVHSLLILSLASVSKWLDDSYSLTEGTFISCANIVGVLQASLMA